MREIFVIVLIVGMVALGSIALSAPSSPSNNNNIIDNVYITKEGYVASTSEELLDIAIKLALKGNTDQFKFYLVTNPLVFFLKPNLWARIEEYSFPGKVKIKLIDYDLSVWTLKEAVK